MALAAELPDLAEGIESVRPEDVEGVRSGVPEKLAALRPLLRGGRLRALVRDVGTLFEILLDRSFPLPWRATAAIVFGLGYFLMSVDLIPDVLPVVGFLDDAAVLAEIVYLLSGDIRRFREHRAAITLQAIDPVPVARSPVEPAPVDQAA
ncbi:MAG TPA: DUF1232 domain-containing protein [Polyangiaceae bacterium]|jgi:uncharacterized membrane protein YkvA (DUF1232 family)